MYKISCGAGVELGAGLHIVKLAPSLTSEQPPNVCISSFVLVVLDLVADCTCNSVYNVYYTCIGSLVVVLDLVAGAKATASIQNHRPFFTHHVGLKIFEKLNL